VLCNYHCPIRSIPLRDLDSYITLISTTEVCRIVAVNPVLGDLNVDRNVGAYKKTMRVTLLY
jgi:hypothetical protein